MVATLSSARLAQDARGELYLLANGTGVPSRATGAVLKLTPASKDDDDDGDGKDCACAALG